LRKILRRNVQGRGVNDPNRLHPAEIRELFRAFPDIVNVAFERGGNHHRDSECGLQFLRQDGAENEARNHAALSLSFDDL
jgi:hypothetical protein